MLRAVPAADLLLKLCGESTCNFADAPCLLCFDTTTPCSCCDGAVQVMLDLDESAKKQLAALQRQVGSFKPGVGPCYIFKSWCKVKALHKAWDEDPQVPSTYTHSSLIPCYPAPLLPAVGGCAAGHGGGGAEKCGLWQRCRVGSPVGSAHKPSPYMCRPAVHSTCAFPAVLFDRHEIGSIIAALMLSWLVQAWQRTGGAEHCHH